VRSYFHTHGLPITISNCSNNYGPYQFPEKMIPLFIAKLRAGEKVPVYGDGQQIRDWIHVGDHVRGIDACLQKGELGETYLFGDDNEVRNLDLTKKLIELVGASEDMIEFVKDRPGHDRRYATDSRKAHEQLGWKPEFTFETGLRNTIDWYLANEGWVDRCRSGAYKDYYKKQYGL